MSKNKEFNIHDDVKHAFGAIGTVLAIYTGHPDELLLDVLLDDEKVIYATPARHWEIVVKAEDKK